jgi:hypothetical protein
MYPSSLEDGILNLLDFIVFRTEGLQGFNSVNEELNNTV